MIYGFSFLLFMLSLATGISVIPRFLRMRKIKQNHETTTGVVSSGASPTGVLVSAVTGKVNYLHIYYHALDEKEHMIEIIDASVFKTQRYAPGDPVEVVYDKNAPWLAYVQTEWKTAIRDLWLAGGELLVSVIALVTGLALKLPA